ncbi:MAG: DinB family protein [Microbacteriaceae bacterium]|nr:DinB family protein [Microbacteriaceae bacterium]MCL2795171.1 DinB family protein [Microbacteriaceae bacterium]
MTDPQFQTDRVGLLVDQWDSSLDLALARLDGLSDDEYLWEPVPGMWSVRRRGSANSVDPIGRGELLLDFSWTRPDPEPLTTIAWRLGHVIQGLEGRWEWTFGNRTAEPFTQTAFDATAAGALAHLRGIGTDWRAGLVGLSDEQLDVPGYGQYPHGLDPQLPFISIIWWVNRELIHHLAECALLRDLYLRRDALGAPGQHP